MDVEEAIEILSSRDSHGTPCGYTNGYAEALDMAIEALRAKKNCEKCEVGNPCLYCKHQFEPQEESEG